MSKKRNRHGQAGPPPKKQKSHSTKLRNPHVHVPKTLPSPANNPQPKKPASKNPNQTQNQPTIPFNAGDRVLLVGEGDFSFALSLVKHHRKRVAALCATCFDSREELVEKYGQAEGYIEEILSAQEEGVDGQAEEEDAEDGSAYNTDDEIENDEEGQENNVLDSINTDTTAPIQTKVLYSIDATKLHTCKPLKKDKQGFTRIVFNFPHVGGKSTDVNRQVRYNQALLHDFFISAKELLTKDKNKEKEYDGEKTGANDVPVGERRKKGGKGGGKATQKEERKVDPTILVTLFEGTPYTLWNIKDLARSAGLKVLRSWAFKSEVYPGYEHARTLGNIRSKDDVGEVDDDDVATKHDRKGGEVYEEEKGNKDDWTGFDDDDDEGEMRKSDEKEVVRLPEGQTSSQAMLSKPEEIEEVRDEREAAASAKETSSDRPETPQGLQGRSARSVQEFDQDKASISKENTLSDPTQKRPGRWRGEERAARTFEFGLGEQEKQKTANVAKATAENDDDEFERFKKKRKRKGGKLFDEDASSEGEK